MIVHCAGYMPPDLERIPHSRGYEVAADSLTNALCFTRPTQRVLKTRPNVTQSSRIPAVKITRLGIKVTRLVLLCTRG